MHPPRFLSNLIGSTPHARSVRARFVVAALVSLAVWGALRLREGTFIPYLEDVASSASLPPTALTQVASTALWRDHETLIAVQHGQTQATDYAASVPKTELCDEAYFPLSSEPRKLHSRMDASSLRWPFAASLPPAQATPLSRYRFSLALSPDNLSLLVPLAKRSEKGAYTMQVGLARLWSEGAPPAQVWPMTFRSAEEEQPVNLQPAAAFWLKDNRHFVVVTPTREILLYRTDKHSGPVARIQNSLADTGLAPLDMKPVGVTPDNELLFMETAFNITVRFTQPQIQVLRVPLLPRTDGGSRARSWMSFLPAMPRTWNVVPITLSPDGTQVACIVTRTGLRTDGPKPQVVSSFGPDSSRTYHLSQYLAAVDLDTGRTRLLTKGQMKTGESIGPDSWSGDADLVSWLPGGRELSVRHGDKLYRLSLAPQGAR